MKIKIIKFLLKKLSEDEKKEILTEAVKDLFNTISENDILKVKNGEWILGGRPQTEAEMKLIASEAYVLTKSKLWKVLQFDLKCKANEITFLKSKTEQDLIAGKITHYLIEQIKKRLESLAKYK